VLSGWSVQCVLVNPNVYWSVRVLTPGMLPVCRCKSSLIVLSGWSVQCVLVNPNVYWSVRVLTPGMLPVCRHDSSLIVLSGAPLSPLQPPSESQLATPMCTGQPRCVLVTPDVYWSVRVLAPDVCRPSLSRRPSRCKSSLIVLSGWSVQCVLVTPNVY
jgi:hypothetical protein